MSGVPEDAVQLVSGLLGHIRQIVGDGASYAMLHYGAVEEGKRLGNGYAAQDLPSILGRVDALLGHKTEIMKDDAAAVTIRIHESSLLATGQRAMQGIIVGLMEGALSSSRHGRYKGTLLPGVAKGELTVELKREG